MRTVLQKISRGIRSMANKVRWVAKRSTLWILYPNLKIGKGVEIAWTQDVLIAENVTIRDQDHGMYLDRPFRLQPTWGAPVRIGNNVWLGAQVVVLKSVSIEDNVVVGAGSIVTRNIESNSVFVGCPAKKIKTLT